MTAKANKSFINGMLAEKAKLANTLIAELLAEVPDNLLERYQTGMNAGSGSLQAIYLDLRRVESEGLDAAIARKQERDRCAQEVRNTTWSDSCLTDLEARIQGDVP